MLISSAAFSIGRGRHRFAGISIRCISFAANFAPWPRIRNEETPQPKISQVPHLMLCSTTNPQVRYLYDLGVDNQRSAVINFNREVHLPEIAGQHCVGSSHGFVFAILTDGSVVAVNPLSGEKLHLPPIPRVPAVDASFGRPFLDIHSKITLSPSLEIAVLLRRPAWLGGEAYFARLAPPPVDDAWTLIPAPIGLPDDCAFHKGRFITVTRHGDLSACKDVGDPSKPRGIVHLSNIKSDGLMYRKYLVESPDGDDLFFVCRDAKDFFSRERCRFWVWRLDKNDRYMWKRVDSLGGLAFFIGPISSFSLRAADFPSLNPDCVYFTADLSTDDRCPPNGGDSLGDTGVFNLQDRTIRLFQPPEARDGVNWLPPTWVVPSRVQTVC